MQWRRALAGGLIAGLVAGIAAPGVAGADDAEMRELVEALQQKVQKLEERLADQEAATGDVQRLEGEIVTLRDDLSTWQDVDVASGSDFEISGYVETSYNYNFNNPRGPRPVPGTGGTNVARIFDVEDSTFNLDAIKLAVENSADEVGDAGFRVDLLFGQQADLIDLDPAFGTAMDAVEIEQGYVNYIANVGNGLELKAGKFVTWIGYEVIESHDNPNLSRSFTFGLSIPFTHTGIGASYKFNDLVTYSHYLVNGWDNTADNNDAKSTGGQLVLTPTEDQTFGVPMEFYFNWIAGHEGGPEGDDDRFVLDWIITAQLNDQWGAALNIDYGESDFNDASVAAGFGAVPGAFNEDSWFGIAGYLTYQHTEALGFALRAEFWEEDNGTRTGIITPDRLPGEDLELFGLTGTVNYWVTDNLFTRAELRVDTANEDIFPGDGGPADFEDSQWTLGFAATYLF